MGNEIANRDKFVDVPGLRPRASDVRGVTGVAAVVWFVSFVAQVAMPVDPDSWANQVAHEFAAGLSGVSFGVLVAALIFDRLRRAADRRVEDDLERRTNERRDFRHRLWVEEYSLPYQGMTELLTGQVSELIRKLFVVNRLRPVSRSLALRGLGASFFQTELHPLNAMLTELDFAKSRMGGGTETLSEFADEIARSLDQLDSYLQLLSGESHEQPDTELVSKYLEDVCAIESEVLELTEVIWERLQDLARLHREFQDERLVPPELSIGIALHLGVHMLKASRAWSSECGKLREADVGGTNESLLLSATILAKRSVLLSRASVDLFEHLGNLQGYMDATYMDGMTFEEGREFIAQMSATTDAASRRAMETARSTRTGIATSTYLARALDSTFAHVPATERAPAHMGDSPQTPGAAT